MARRGSSRASVAAPESSSGEARVGFPLSLSRRAGSVGRFACYRGPGWPSTGAAGSEGGRRRGLPGISAPSSLPWIGPRLGYSPFEDGRATEPRDAILRVRDGTACAWADWMRAGLRVAGWAPSVPSLWRYIPTFVGGVLW